jgi:ATP-dependent Clp protease ATP-binding subunit ClpX
VRNAYCSFCRKSCTEVGPLVEGPNEVYICGACAALAVEIVEKENRRRTEGHPGPEGPGSYDAGVPAPRRK